CRLAPVEASRHDQRIETIVLGRTVEYRKEALLHASLVHSKVERCAARRLQDHVVQHDVANCAGYFGMHSVAALVDCTKPEVLEQRHTFRQRNWCIETIDGSSHSAF